MLRRAWMHLNSNDDKFSFRHAGTTKAWTVEFEIPMFTDKAAETTCALTKAGLQTPLLEYLHNAIRTTRMCVTKVCSVPSSLRWFSSVDLFPCRTYRGGCERSGAHFTQELCAK